MSFDGALMSFDGALKAARKGLALVEDLALYRKFHGSLDAMGLRTCACACAVALTKAGADLAQYSLAKLLTN
jgi:hypothetical protein